MEYIINVPKGSRCEQITFVNKVLYDTKRNREIRIIHHVFIDILGLCAIFCLSFIRYVTVRSKMLSHVAASDIPDLDHCA